MVAVLVEVGNMEEKVHEGELSVGGKFNVSFRKRIDQDLLRHDSIKELLHYINNKDAEIEKVKVLVTRANRELRPTGKQLYVRKASRKDKEADHRICLTKR